MSKPLHLHLCAHQWVWNVARLSLRLPHTGLLSLPSLTLACFDLFPVNIFLRHIKQTKVKRQMGRTAQTAGVP